MKDNSFYLALLGLVMAFMTSCIGDDFIFDEVEPMIIITSNIETLALGTTFQIEAKYLNNVGDEQVLPKSWTSSAPEIISVDQAGLISALQVGQSVITAELVLDNEILEDQITVTVGEETSQSSNARTGVIQSTSSYRLEGNFSLEKKGESLVLDIDESYQTTSALPGLYIYLTNNRNSNSGALEIGEVTVFSGAHSYILPDDVGINDYQYILYYCKPFSVKVGDGEFEN